MNNIVKICYLNHDSRANTGAGGFYNAISGAIKKIFPAEIEVLTSENILYPNKFKLILALPVIRKIIKKCDIIHALDGWPYGVIAAIAALGLNKKLIITAVGTGAVQPLYRPIKRQLMKWAYRRADLVVAVSNNTKKEILKVIPDLEIEVINHGVDAKKFEGRNDRDDRNVNNSIKQSDRSSIIEQLKPYILSVGALKKRKGFDISIKAFAEIAPKFPSLKYVIVGSGPEKKNLQSLIDSNQLQGRILFLENLPESVLAALYQNAELFILLPQDINKDIEGFGLVFLEAAARGLPVVAAKETSAEDAVLDARNGFLVPPKNFDQAAEAMGKILSDKTMREKFSQESLDFAKKMSWQKAAEAYVSIYRRI